MPVSGSGMNSLLRLRQKNKESYSEFDLRFGSCSDLVGAMTRREIEIYRV